MCAIVLISALTACGESTTELVRGPAVELSVASGDGQSAQAGAEVPQPIVVEARRSDGTVHWGTAINVTILSGEGGLTHDGGGVSGNNSTISGVGVGRANVLWTLGPAGEEQRIRFWTSRGSAIDSLSVEVTATSLPDGGA